MSERFLSVQELPARLREMRRAAKLTQQQVAQRAGCSRSTISRLERGSGEVRVQRLLAFALAVKAPLLLRGNEREAGENPLL